MSLGQFFNETHKRLTNLYAGIITKQPYTWVVCDHTPPDSVLAQFEKGRDWWFVNRPGKINTLYRKEGDQIFTTIDKPSVECPNTELHPDAICVRGNAVVTVSVCRKCQFYTKPTRGVKASCGWIRQKRCGNKTPELAASEACLTALSKASTSLTDVVK